MNDQEQQSVTKTQETGGAPQNGNLLKLARQIIIFVLGMSVVLVGIAMLVLPGPAMIVIPAGLAILATEFIWAKRWLNYLKQRALQVAEWTMEAAKTKEPEPKPEADRQYEGTAR